MFSEAKISASELDDYEIIEKTIYGHFGDVFHAINNKTKKEIAIIVDVAYEKDFQLEINEKIKSHVRNFPFFVKTIGVILPKVDKSKLNSLCIEVKEQSKFMTSINATSFNVVLIYEYFKGGRLLDITQKYLESKDGKSNILNPTIRSKIIFGIASFIKKLHEADIIYEKLAIENIVLDSNFESKIIDYSLADFIINKNNTRSQLIPFEASPEIMNGEEDITPLTDSYSF